MVLVAFALAVTFFKLASVELCRVLTFSVEFCTALTSSVVAVSSVEFLLTMTSSFVSSRTVVGSTELASF